MKAFSTILLLFRKSWMYGVYLLFYGLLLTVFYQKMGSFGCFDDCPNFMAGWFLLKGRVLYEQIFYNHQPLMVYISGFIQLLGDPDSIFQLVFIHRIFVYLFALAFGFLLLWKFGWKALLFLLLYESTKYYFFGDRFLAEGLIVYPLVYLLGLFLTGLQKKAFSVFDLLFGTFSALFVLWMREPYVPVALFLYAGFLYFLRRNRLRFSSICILILGSGLWLLVFPFSDYYFSVITVNTSFHLQNSFSFHELFNAFFYPVSIFFYGQETQLRIYEMFLSGIFLLLSFVTLKQRRHIKSLVIIFLTLGFSNLRPNLPGSAFYEAFHMLSWYALFLFSISFLLFQMKNHTTRFVFLGVTSLILVSLVIFLALPSSYIREKTDAQGLFYEGYNQYYTAGEIINRLSTPDQTLFLDGWNDLIYWQADRVSPYQYSWYTSIMSGFSRYTEAREALLKETPPDFFYGACKEWPFSKVSKEFLSDYKRFSFDTTPTCLYMKKTLVKSVPDGLEEIKKKFNYSLEVGPE